MGPKPTLGSFGFSENCPHWSTVPLLIIVFCFCFIIFWKRRPCQGIFLQLVSVAVQCPSCPRACQQCIHSWCLAPSFFLFKTNTKTSDKSHSSFTAVHPFLLSCPLFCSFLPFNAFPLFSYICSKTKTKTKTKTKRHRQRPLFLHLILVAAAHPGMEVANRLAVHPFLFSLQK